MKPPSRRLVAIAAGVVVLVSFGLLAGEYTMRDWMQLRRDLAAERSRLRVLQSDVDSLAKLADALARDPATQERVAREEFGMIRDGETLYRLVPR